MVERYPNDAPTHVFQNWPGKMCVFLPQVPLQSESLALMPARLRSSLKPDHVNRLVFLAKNLLSLCHIHLK